MTRSEALITRVLPIKFRSTPLHDTVNVIIGSVEDRDREAPPQLSGSLELLYRGVRLGGKCMLRLRTTCATRVVSAQKTLMGEMKHVSRLPLS